MAAEISPGLADTLTEAGDRAFQPYIVQALRPQRRGLVGARGEADLKACTPYVWI